MFATAHTRAVPSPPLQQKVQKNFRLTEIGVRMLQQLAMQGGVSESAVIERLVREEMERRGSRLDSDRS
jgi:hypothetical protein